MDIPRRRFLAVAGAGLAATAGCSAPATDASANTDDANGSAADEASPATDLEAPQEQPLVDLYDAIIPSVVRIRVYGPTGPQSQGSGWVSQGGTIVTNAHVVADAQTVRVQFFEGEWREAEILGSDAYSDLAALSVDDRPAYARPLSFVADQPPVGTEVAAFGAPFGLGGSLSAGIVSGQDRSLQTVQNFTVADAVQTDAALNPGNSGGPLTTLDGEVAGVVTQAGGENVGFAISAALAKRVIPSLVEEGEYVHSFMGVMIQSVTPLLAQANELPAARGVYVGDAMADGPADGVLRGTTDQGLVEGVTVPTGGDVILRLGGTRIDTLADLGTYLALETSPGDDLEVGIWREEEEQTVSLTLGARPPPP
jgi:serine protease Do